MEVIFKSLQAIKTTCDSIILGWDCEIQDAAEESVNFEVFVKGEMADGSPFDRVKAPEKKTCKITGLKPETPYSLYVVAVREGEDVAQYPDGDEGLAVTTLPKEEPAPPAPIEWKKPAIIGGGILAAIALIALLVGLLKPKGGDVTTPEPPKELKYVYSCAYDGFVNIHETPEYSGENVGKFLNGPEGAILLEDLGEWTKIDMNGVVGYVASKYVQDEPTIAYTGNVDVTWLEGVWAASGYDKVEIFNNGVFRSAPNGQVGTWILQNNEIKFTLVYTEGEDEDEEEDQTVFAETLPIQESPDALGEFRRQRFYSQQEYEQYGAPGVYTKAGFRETGKNLLTMVESYSPKE